jgi:hypothetical protein
MDPENQQHYMQQNKRTCYQNSTREHVMKNENNFLSACWDLRRKWQNHGGLVLQF